MYTDKPFTSKQVDHYISKKIWTKEYEEYEPFLTVRSFPSRGMSSRTKSNKSNRVIHTFSQLELDALYLFEYSNKVIDIREQYPLMYIEDTLRIAEEVNIKHPNYQGESVYMTTDFFLTIQEGSKTYNVARTIKPSKDLENKRVIEKFEIERRYYEKNGIDFGILTEKELSRTLTHNMEAFYQDSYNIKSSERIENHIINTINALKQSAGKKKYTLFNLSQIILLEYDIDLGHLVNIIFKMILDNKLKFDLMNKKFDINKIDITELIPNYMGNTLTDYVIGG